MTDRMIIHAFLRETTLWGVRTCTQFFGFGWGPLPSSPGRRSGLLLPKSPPVTVCLAGVMGVVVVVPDTARLIDGWPANLLFEAWRSVCSVCLI